MQLVLFSVECLQLYFILLLPRALLSASVAQMCFNVSFFGYGKDRSDFMAVKWPQNFKRLIGKVKERGIL